jgi:hypothetical protein
MANFKSVSTANPATSLNTTGISVGAAFSQATPSTATTVEIMCTVA